METWTVTEPDRLTLEEGVRRLRVSLMGGRVNVVGTDGPARVEVTAIDDRPLTVSLSDDGTLTVSHEEVPKWSGLLWWLFGHRFRVDVSIAVPAAIKADLRVVSGSVVASALHGGATVDVTSGRVTLLGLDGDIRAKVVSGSIEALSLGGRLNLETISGEITVADASSERVRARTISGSLTCDLDNPLGPTDVSLETTSGEITARVREDSDLSVTLHAISGRITCAFPELDRLGRNSVAGRLGAGKGHLVANATSGNIALLRRPVDFEDEA